MGQLQKPTTGTVAVRAAGREKSHFEFNCFLFFSSYHYFVDFVQTPLLNCNYKRIVNNQLCSTANIHQLKGVILSVPHRMLDRNATRSRSGGAISALNRNGVVFGRITCCVRLFFCFSVCSNEEDRNKNDYEQIM